VAFSSDGGNSFDQPFVAGLDFVAALCEGSLLRVSLPATNGSGGRIIFSAPNNVNNRIALSLWVSRDEAATWESPRRIWSGPYSGYSDMALTPAGEIAVLFEGINNGLRFLTVPVSFLDAPPPEVARPNTGLWTFVELTPGQYCMSKVTNILDRTTNGYGLNLFSDQQFPVLSGPLEYQSSSAIGFNGTGGLWLYPSVTGNPFDFGASDSFSIETMVRMSPSQTFGVIVAKDWASKLPSWWLRVQEGGYVRFLVSDSTGAEPSVRSAQKINDGTWHKLVAVRDATNRLLKIYVDGVLSAQAADTTTRTLANGRALAIGRFTANTSANLTADVDFLRIVPWVLDPTAFLNWPLALVVMPPGPPDSDGDGEPDEIEYAFGSDAYSAASRLQFGINKAGTSFAVNFFRLNDPAVNAGLLLSTNLVDWASSIPGISMQQSNNVFQVTPGGNGFSVSAVQLNFRDDRLAPNQGLYFRLAVFK
jgi:hypothetical protein